jgi:hypothetical protein
MRELEPVRMWRRFFRPKDFFVREKMMMMMMMMRAHPERRQVSNEEIFFLKSMLYAPYFALYHYSIHLLHYRGFYSILL